MAQPNDTTTATTGEAGPLPIPTFWHLGGSAIAPVAELAQKAAARVELLQIPEEACPRGDLLGVPFVAVSIGADGRPMIADIKAHIDLYRTKPAFREGTATALTLESFVDLVNRHASLDTAIFLDADWRKPKLTAVIDYHTRAATPASDGPPKDRASGIEGEDDHARHGRHRVVYAFPLSEPWKVWVANDGTLMDQGAFAEFLEEHIHELGSPNGSAEEREWQDRFKTEIADPADIIDLSRGLEVKVGASVKTKTKLASGETQLVFETSHTDSEGRELTVPGLFLLSIPVFYRGDAQRILVRLRYRVVGGAIKWAYVLHRPDEAVDATVRADADQVLFTTGLPVYDGAPEAK